MKAQYGNTSEGHQTLGYGTKVSSTKGLNLEEFCLVRRKLIRSLAVTLKQNQPKATLTK